MAYIRDVNITSGNTTTQYLIEPTLYGAASTTDSGATYNVTIDNNFALVNGVAIQAKFSVTNKVNATLQANSTGAKNIYYNNAQIAAGTLKANHTYTFVYDGTQWQLVGDIDTNTTYTNGTGLNLNGTTFSVKYGTEAGTAAQGNDSRLSDARTPKSHTHGNIQNDGTLGTANVARAVVTNASNQITTDNFAQDSPTVPASGTTTSLEFIDTVSQGASGKITATKKKIPNVSKDTAGLAPKGAAVSTQSQSTKFLREDGSWAAPSYTTNTDQKVKQNANTENKEYSILLKTTDNATGETGEVKFGATTNKLVTINPSTGKITAPGGLAGDASSVNGHTVLTNVPANAVFTDTNKYHKTGSWNNLTYTATAVNSADELKFTIPTGTTGTTVALGNHTHTLNIATDTGTTALTFAANTKYKLTAGGNSYIFTTQSDAYRLNQSTLDNTAALSSLTHASALIYTAKGGGNTITDKPTGVDAFGVLSFKTADGWYGQLLMSSNTSSGIYWRTATTLSGGWKTLLDSSNTTAPASVPTLSWNSESTVFTLNGSAIKIKAMAKPTYTFTDLTAHPITISGYGITDAKIASGVITLGSSTITPVTSVNGHTGSSVSVTAGDLGLASALRFIGKTTSTMVDGFTGTPAGISGYSTPIVGDVVLDSSSDAEYVCISKNDTTYTWELLGRDGSWSLSNHVHGNLTNAGTLTSTATIANGDKLVIVDVDSTAASKITGTTITFDGSTATKALTQKGTWETFNNYSHPTGDGNLHVPANGTGNNGKFLQATATAGSYQWASVTKSTVGLDNVTNDKQLPIAGGTLTGAVTFANNTWNVVGDDIQIGDINEAGTLGIQGKNGNTAIRFTTYNQTTKTTGGKITWDGSKFSITSTTPIDASISGNAATATTASSVAWANVTGKPSTFSPSAHDHNRLNSIGRLNSSADAIAFNTTTSVGNRMSWCIYDSASRSKDATNSPSFDASVINMPWDWGAYITQIAVANAGTRIQIRGANHTDHGEGANPRYTPVYGAWREVVTAAKATKIGDTNKPVYISNTGEATAISYTIEKSVPSNAVFTDHYAWSDITDKPLLLKYTVINNSTAFSESGTAEIFGTTDNTNGKFAVLRMQANSPESLRNNYASGVAWKGGDTYGMISVAYGGANVKIAGGNGTNPVWWFGLNATSGKTYTFPSDSKTLCATDGSNASGSWGISITGSATSATNDSDGNAINSTYLKKSGGKMTGTLAWTDSNSLPEATSLSYFLGIDAFSNGGTTKWITAANLRTSIGAAAASHGTHVPTSGNAGQFLRGDVAWSNQLGITTLDSTAFINTLTLFNNQGTESATTAFDATKCSWGIGFKRQWNTGTTGAIHAGIYAYGISSWRAGLVFRVKTGTNAASAHDTTALYLNHDGGATFANTVNATTFKGALTGNASSASTVSAKLAADKKTYLLGTQTTITGTAANVELTGDTNVYLHTRSGGLSATEHIVNDGTGIEKVSLKWNSTDLSLDFIFA